MTQMQAIQPLRGIAMSGYGMEEDVRQSLTAGFSEHLVKPIKIPQLLAAMQRLAVPFPRRLGVNNLRRLTRTGFKHA